MMKYITKIQARVSIAARKKTSNIFDGSYKSIYTGNGFDFENLREYIPGDSIRDIDWKASARSKNLLVKQYIAEKKHNLMLVFDTGKSFLADTAKNESKKEVAIIAGGTLAYLSAHNGDNIGAIYNRGGLIQFHPLRMGLGNLERILTSYDKEDFSGFDSDLNKSLEYIIRNISKRMIIVIISDAGGIRKIDDNTLKKLCFRHDVLAISIGDATVTGKHSYDVKKSIYVSDYISKNKKLMKLEQQVREQIASENTEKLVRHAIVSAKIDSEEEIMNKIMELLERHKYATNKC